MKRENEAIWSAAEEANRQFGQWMPQRWIEIFIKLLTPPAPVAPADAEPITGAQMDAIEAAATTDAVRETFGDVLAHLVAAVSLLERTSKAKKAAASDKIFAVMISDYKKSIERGRAALTPAATPDTEGK